MTEFGRYDPYAPIADGRTVIEASAGTGKTFTIAAVVTRLVAEEGLPLERILVVTFTRAATAELKDRVRRRMVTTLGALRGSPVGGPADDHIRVLRDADRDIRELYFGPARGGIDPLRPCPDLYDPRLRAPVAAKARIPVPALRRHGAP